jgi:hypothetical protein
MKATEQFDYVLKVLKSSETEAQLSTSTRLFENFKMRWENKLECFEMVNFIYKFYNEKTKTLKNIIKP